MSQENKTYSHAGISRLKGELKVRYANDMMRVKVLAKNGHSDIDLVELKEPMSKAAIAAHLVAINFDNGNAEIRACLEAENAKRNPPPKAEKPKTEPTPADTVVPLQVPVGTEMNIGDAAPGTTVEIVPQLEAA